MLKPKWAEAPKPLILAAALLGATGSAAAPLSAALQATPTSILSGAPDADWRQIDPNDLLVLDLDGGSRVVILLADAFAPRHLANIRELARAHWYDGLSIERVQDNYVVQWGDPDAAKPLPSGIVREPPAEYDRPAAGLALSTLPYRDTFADRVGYVAGFPVAQMDGAAWLVHCYGMVGVGRDLNPDTGTGAELYAVIGHAPRALDRNIAVVGRVIAGMEVLAALPRGTGDLGFYPDPRQRSLIRRVRLAVDLPAAERPSYQRLGADSASFRPWSTARANRQDSFFVRPANAVDVCNAMPPVRKSPDRR